MPNKQSLQVSSQQLQFLGRLSGVEIAPKRLRMVAQQVTALLQNLSTLNPTELQAVEPATIFPPPSEPMLLESNLERPFVSNELSVAFDTREVTVRGQLVKLTNIEYKLLCTLIKNVGQPLPNETLLAEIWGPQHENTAYLPKMHVHHLRKKIETDPANPQIVVTERGVGYKFVVPT